MPVLYQRICPSKSDLSSLRHVWGKYKEEVPDVSDSNQNMETTCKSEIKLTEPKDFRKTSQK